MRASTFLLGGLLAVVPVMTDLVAADAATTAMDLRQRMAAGETVAPAAALADLGDAATREQQAASFTAMAQRVRSGTWDYRVIAAREDHGCAVVVVRIVRDGGVASDRLAAYTFVDRAGWKLLMSGAQDPRMTGLTEDERTRFAALGQWYQRFTAGQEPLVERVGAPAPLVVPAVAGTETPTEISEDHATSPSHAEPPVMTGAAAGAAEEEEDEADPYLKAGVAVRPWTEIQRRSSFTTFLPSAVPLPKGDFNYRVVHVAQEVIYDNYRTNLVGLDDNVKIGIEVGYGITDGLDVMLQRSNGHDLQVEGGGTEPTSFDYYDLLFRYQFLNQADAEHGGIADAALVVGSTLMLRNQTDSDVSFNCGVLLERNLLDDRLRIGAGVFRAGLSAYEKTLGIGPDAKLFPDEYAQIPVGDEVPDKSTTAVPLSLKIALDEHWQLFADGIFPINGYRTGLAPSLAAGVRLNTNTHEFSFYCTNTANVAFNGVVTGGNDRWTNLNLFAFSITAHL